MHQLISIKRSVAVTTNFCFVLCCELGADNNSLFVYLAELGVLVITILQGKEMAAMDSNGERNVVVLIKRVLV